MDGDSTLKYVRIAMAVALMVATVFVVGRSLYRANAPAALPLSGVGDTPSIPTETGVFRLSRLALEYRDAPDTPPTGRTLETFYARRAFPGAPPPIPHPLVDPTTYGGPTCLACHGDGGWVEEREAYAPVTPHPELVNCVQCHVVRSGAPAFRGSTFQRMPPPTIQRASLPDGPPVIPHDLEMRNNCLACHAGPAAVQEIRVSHPERVNCRQCHAVGSAVAPTFMREPGPQP